MRLIFQTTLREVLSVGLRYLKPLSNRHLPTASPLTLIRCAKVSNISDGGYLGVHRTVALMVPLLQGPLVNPHATLITLFMNAVDENLTDQDRMADMMDEPMTSRLLKYLPPKTRAVNTSSPEVIKLSFARDIVAHFDRIFDR